MTDLKTAIPADADGEHMLTIGGHYVMSLEMDSLGPNGIRKVFTQEMLQAANEVVAKLPAQEIILWAMSSFGDRIALSSSFGIQSSVMLHLVSSLSKDTSFPVIWVDTGYLPKETYHYFTLLLNCWISI